MFVVRLDAEFTADAASYLTDVNTIKSRKPNRPVKLFHTLALVKNTSKLIVNELVDSKSRLLLMKTVVHVVLIDKATNRPMPFPASFKSFVNQHSPANIPQINVSKLPKECHESITPFKWQRKILLLDSDFNGHASNLLYITSSLECISAAQENNHPVTLSKTLRRSMLKRLGYVILGECKTGDIVQFEMWQDIEKEFNFIVSLKGKMIAFVTLVFFE